MLFNSIAFMFWFLPAVLFSFFTISQWNKKIALFSLIVAAFVFYGCWNPKYIPLLLTSIVVNYGFGIVIAKAHEKNDSKYVKLLFIIGLAFDLALLCYYKYMHFFLDQYNVITGAHYAIGQIILPLGISFFTFTQIAFLADVYQKKSKEYNFLYYILFVTYFPHLIAGPILHHKEMITQFLNERIFRFSRQNFTVGILIFAIGLIKKVLIADHLAPYADLVFSHDMSTSPLNFVDVWVGVLSYTFQLYFDFSGYSDMAVGLSKMFNILLPVNFNSPYKSLNIIDFWRRWHITLSRFLRDYLYIPLGGNRFGEFQRYKNLSLTMLLGGFWHGASWTFVIWGGLHGLYLAVNHYWQSLVQHSQFSWVTTRWIYRLMSGLLTFALVTIAWVFFRADSVNSAGHLLYVMFGYHGLTTSPESYYYLQNIHVLNPMVPLFQVGEKIIFPDMHFIYFLSASMIICFFMPNSQQLFSQYQPALETYPGDIPPLKGWLRNVDWIRGVQLRWIGYVWLSYFASTILMGLFYFKNIDAYIFKYFPTKNRSTFHVDVMQGDFRSNLLSNNIFLGPERKIMLLGSSYVRASGAFKFEANGKQYKSGTIANVGNTLANGFRQALAVLGYSNVYPIDTLILGVSPIGFGSNIGPSVAMNDQCTESFESLGMTAPKPMEKLASCQPIPFHFSTYMQMALNPGDKRYFQYHGFLNKMWLGIKDTAMHAPESSVTALTLNTVKVYDDWFESLKKQATIDRKDAGLDIKNGRNEAFSWQNRGILESMEPSGEVYVAFQRLKKICDQKQVKLVVYNSPTVSNQLAPDIYPKGFLESYNLALMKMMHTLGIRYINYGNEFIWDSRYAFDFIHMDPHGRERIHAKLIQSLYLNRVV